jgi:CRISPR/Cas system-associated exonuclease Cas4 (RecB family)
LFSFGRLTLFRKLFDYYIPMEQAWPTIRGHAVHNLLERVIITDMVDGYSEPWKERRLSIEVPHPDDSERVLTVSGQYDVYYPWLERLIDYKTASRIPSEPYEGHVLQVNTYAALLREAGYGVDELYLVYINFQKHVVLPVEVIPHEVMLDAIQQTAWFLQECLEQRVLPPRSDWCNPLVEQHFCPFYEFCKANPDWHQVPEGAVFAEGKAWTRDEWHHELFKRESQPPKRRTEWIEEV